MDIVSKITGDSLSATEFNQIPSELEGLITSVGLTPASGDVAQISQAVARMSSGGDFYTDSGSADSYVLGTIGSQERPSAYFDGMAVKFFPGNTNTGGVATVNVAGLGNKNIKSGSGAGANPSVGALTSGLLNELIYDATNGVFKVAFETTPITPAFENKFFHLQQQEAPGVNPAAFGVTTYKKMALNTVLTNEIAGASLSSEEITLPAGDYIAMGYVPLSTGTEADIVIQSRLLNITDSTEELIGMSCIAGDTTIPLTSLSGKFTLSGTKVLELQARCGSGSWRPGGAVNIGTYESYSDIKIWKVG